MYANNRVELELCSTELSMVEVYVKKGSPVFGAGRPIIYDLLGVQPGDTTFFRHVGFKRYVARFFDIRGKERLIPSVHHSRSQGGEC